MPEIFAAIVGVAVAGAWAAEVANVRSRTRRELARMGIFTTPVPDNP
jgi:hypothetical protein